ncbi:ImmA/IrrE family metallo-endopeptidase [Candidatus Saccharibacteria bacterium]|jgi:hypothetical protein|nr:ImmA/IrrE family metallo-endopeptidase [Candidatus Saccharibacteria bacterium]
MDVTNSSVKTNDFIDKLAGDYPAYKFKPGKQDHWSPRLKTITYNPDEPEQKLIYGVLHELAHALLDHDSYSSDFELVRLESDAWCLAAKIGKKYKVNISEEHIQNCLDTYRDWLHRRSACPTCGTHVLQKDSSSYHCYNCQTSWHVSSGRFVRPYRRMANT